MKVDWTKEYPKSQGWWWHWNGDPDSATNPVFIMYSDTNDQCFVSKGQLGLSYAVEFEHFGGLWSAHPIDMPEQMDVKERILKSCVIEADKKPDSVISIDLDVDIASICMRAVERDATRECFMIEDAALLAAILKSAEEHGLGKMEEDVYGCRKWHTKREK